ncbi:MAG TPA: hypothetical protein VK586_06820 [Streptosporangiaceae bacterium]|nr:hypothetical protein [Streptosporangiaceae bacterium]
MTSFDAYGRQEKAIAAADISTTRERWEYGRRLACDPLATDRDGTLRDGVMGSLITAARRRGVTLTVEEIADRLAAGIAYPCESQIRGARRDFGSWAALAAAGFPEAGAEPGDQPYDPRGAAEKARAVDRQLALGEPDADQLALFPDDRYDVLSTLAELRKYAEDSDARTRRHAAKDAERLDYLNQLSEAVDGDESKTWEEAQAALDAA